MTWLSAQHHGAHDPSSTAPPKVAHPKAVDRQFEAHRPDLRLPPRTAFEHLASGHERVQAQRNHATLPPEQRRALPAPKPRPAGAGELLAVVLICADVHLDPSEVLGQRRADLLVLSSPGPTLDSASIAAMERATVDQRASLILILGHDDCTSRTKQPTTPAQEVLARRVGLPTEGRGRALPEHLDWLAQQVFSTSDRLRELQQRDHVQVVTGRVDRRTQAITWLDNGATRAQPVGTNPPTPPSTEPAAATPGHTPPQPAQGTGAHGGSPPR